MTDGSDKLELYDPDNAGKHAPCFRGDHLAKRGRWTPHVGDVPSVYDRQGEVWVCAGCLDSPPGQRGKWIKALSGEIPPDQTALPVEEWNPFDSPFPVECEECGAPVTAVEAPDSPGEYRVRCRSPSCDVKFMMTVNGGGDTDD